MLVSRYDRAAADAIAAPALERLPMLLDPVDQPGYLEARVFGLITAYDPAAIAPLIGARQTERNDGTAALKAAVAWPPPRCSDVRSQSVAARRTNSRSTPSNCSANGGNPPATQRNHRST